MQLHSLYSGVPFIEIGGHINDFGGFQRTLAPKSPGCTYQSAHLTLTSPGKKDRGGICASLRGIHVWNRKFCTGTWILTPLGVQRCCCAGALCSKVLIWRWVALGCISVLACRLISSQVASARIPATLCWTLRGGNTYQRRNYTPRQAFSK